MAVYLRQSGFYVEMHPAPARVPSAVWPGAVLQAAVALGFWLVLRGQAPLPFAAALDLALAFVAGQAAAAMFERPWRKRAAMTLATVLALLAAQEFQGPAVAETARMLSELGFEGAWVELRRWFWLNLA